MKLENAKQVVPNEDNVLVKILLNTKEEQGVILETEVNRNTKKVELYRGEVITLGTDLQKESPVQLGDLVVFSKFAGYHISTKEKKMYKLAPSSMLMGKMKTIEDIDKKEVFPLGGRVLVEVQPVDIAVDGLVLSDTEAKDPTLEDLDYGYILKFGPECKNQNLKETSKQLVAFTPYVGESISPFKRGKHNELRLIHEMDILFFVD